MEEPNWLDCHVLVLAKGCAAGRIKRDVGGELLAGCVVHALKALHTRVERRHATAREAHERDPRRVDTWVLGERIERHTITSWTGQSKLAREGDWLTLLATAQELLIRQCRLSSTALRRGASSTLITIKPNCHRLEGMNLHTRDLRVTPCGRASSQRAKHYAGKEPKA